MNANARVFPQFYVGEGIWFRRSAVCFRARGATQQSDEIKGDCFAAGAAKKQWANLDDRGAACAEVDLRALGGFSSLGDAGSPPHPAAFAAQKLRSAANLSPQAAASGERQSMRRLLSAPCPRERRCSRRRARSG